MDTLLFDALHCTYKHQAVYKCCYSVQSLNLVVTQSIKSLIQFLVISSTGTLYIALYCSVNMLLNYTDVKILLPIVITNNIMEIAQHRKEDNHTNITM